MADLDLRTDYKDDILDSSVNEKRIYNLVDSDGNIVVENVSLVDNSIYNQKGDSFGAVDINKTNQAVLDLNQSLTTRYNEETDYLEVLFNKVWTAVQYLGLKWNGTVYNNGVFSSGFSKLTPTLQYLSGTYATQYYVPNVKPTITYGSTSISISYSPTYREGVYNGYTYALAYLPVLIDLSNFKYCDIICSRSLSVDSAIQAVFTNTAPTENSIASVSTVNKAVNLTNGTNVIDISSLSGEQYLAFGCNTGGGTCTLAITSIRFYN